MSEMNPIEREQKKKQLRGRVIDTATQDLLFGITLCRYLV